MGNQRSEDDSDRERLKPVLPETNQRMPLVFCEPPHPAVLASEKLLTFCELRTQRRSGPGGQHRNKTSSGVFLTHGSSGIVGEATERRSQAANRTVALQRLRFCLAVQLRTPSIFDRVDSPLESDVRDRYAATTLKLNDQNDAKPAVLALLLNDLHASGGQPSLVAQQWSVSTSSIVKFVKSNGDAFSLVNRMREHHGRRALK